ncbi:ABC transporter substrate-binding protein [Radicibacter daui]|uniref:ABC transporter substrate-binding protein n=1 Tax=Radicibacter daui TaxID=3064829 RepID=UPI004046E055
MRLTTSLAVALIAGPMIGAFAGNMGNAHAGEASGTLTLYTSQTPEIAQMTVDAFQAKHPKVRVEWTRNGTTQLMNVLQTEILAGDPKPDVLLVADTINLGSLKKQGRLMAYPEAPVGAFDKSTYDAGKMMFGTKIIATGIGYNTANAKPVKRWADLLVDSNKSAIAVPSPLYSGAALYHLHTLTGTPGIGWAFYEGLNKLGITPEGGNGPALKALAGGMAKYAVLVDADTLRAKKAGSPVDFIYPEDGVSFITEPVAILSTAHNVPAAKAFVDFLLSHDGQELVAKQGYLPLDPKVAPPEGFPKLSDIKLLPLDADKAIDNDAGVREHFQQIFGG